MATNLISGFVLLSVVLTVLTLTFDPAIGQIFTGMLLLAMFYYSQDNSRRFELERNKNRLKSLVLAIGGYLLLTVFSKFIFPILDKTLGSIDLAKTLQIMSTARSSILFSQLNPVLANNLAVQLFTFGIVIPFIETIWLIILFEALLDMTHTNPGKFPWLNSTWFVFAIIVALFTILHFQALGVTNNLALANVAIFTLISLGIALIEGQMLGAILFHVTANTASLLLTGQFASLLASPALVTGIIAVAALFVFTSKPIRSIFARVT